MTAATYPDWPQIALYAFAAALFLMLLFRLPVVGRLLRFLVSLALAAVAIFLLVQQAPYHPELARLTGDLGLDSQEVVGREVRIRMSSDGHFWANATINGVRRRMLIDSGATVTAISEATAAAAGVESSAAPVPVVLRTANGLAPARAASVEELRLGNILARDLNVVVSPAFGDMEVIGMNLLSKLASWRVEGRTLILVPHHPQAEREGGGRATPTSLPNRPAPGGLPRSRMSGVRRRGEVTGPLHVGRARRALRRALPREPEGASDT